MHQVGGQRRGRHHSVVGGVLEFFHPYLVSVLFPGPSLLELNFFQKSFSPSGLRDQMKKFEVPVLHVVICVSANFSEPCRHKRDVYLDTCKRSKPERELSGYM